MDANIETTGITGNERAHHERHALTKSWCASWRVEQRYL